MKSSLRWPVLWWLRFWARLALASVKPVIIGVTGSAGKSSLVAAIAPIAALKFRRVKVARQANSESGIPADILGLHFANYSLLDWLRIFCLAPVRFTLYALRFTRPFDAYLVEMGVDDPNPPKNMGYLLTILKPQIGVILNALPAHAQQFAAALGTADQSALVAAVAREKGKIITQNRSLATAIVNADQPQLARLALANKNAKTITFGISDYAHIKITSVSATLAGTKFSFRYRHLPVQLKLPRYALPDYYGHTFAAAIACGIALKLPIDQISSAISANFILPPGRGQIFCGVKETIIIDSSYNSSAQPTIGSLKLLPKIATRRTKVAVLGDMRELGRLAQREHEKVAKVAGETADKIVLVGPLMKQYALPFLYKSGKSATWFPAAGQAADYLKTTLGGKEVILIKGSQNGIFLEIVVERLLANRQDAARLCRRGEWWDRQRAPYSL